MENIVDVGHFAVSEAPANILLRLPDHAWDFSQLLLDVHGQHVQHARQVLLVLVARLPRVALHHSHHVLVLVLEDCAPEVVVRHLFPVSDSLLAVALELKVKALPARLA